MASTSAPAPMRISRHGTVPFSAAFIRAVSPSLSFLCISSASTLVSRSSRAVTCPPTLAAIKEDIPSERVLPASAPFPRRIFMTSVRPSPDASHSAVTPEVALASTSAPASSNIFTTTACPMMLASIRAVMSSLSFPFASAPADRSAFVTSTCPALAAAINGVSLSQSAEFTSTPSFSILWTSFLSPSEAAVIRRAPGELIAAISSLLVNWSCMAV
mmetsp:Transcript_16814/g.37814  ORF Transcript_16814/g.37814 Transcript_16814/m.37814 type:complete len:216 (-) Transcript_16814:806-1453(-)